MRYPYREPTPEERAFYDRRDQFDIKELDKIVHEKGPSNLRGNFLIQPFTGDGPEFQDGKLIQPAGRNMYGVFLGGRIRSLLLVKTDDFPTATAAAGHLSAALFLSGIETLETFEG